MRKLWLLLLALPFLGASGCPAPSRPIVVPPAKTYTIAVHVCDGPCAKDLKVPNARVIVLDSSATTDGAGNTTIAGLRAGISQVCTLAVQGFADTCVNVSEPGTADISLELTRTGPPPITTRVHVDGPIFRLPDGTPWRWAFVSNFRALQRWDRGEDLAPLVAWTRSVGANGWRVFVQYTGVNGIGVDAPFANLPAERVRAFVQWAAAQGLRIELTILADCDQLGMSHDAQKTRVKAIVDAVANEPNVFLELSNEPFKNGADVDAIARELGYTDPRNRPVPMATGGYDTVGTPNLIVLDYFTDHAERKPTWPGEAGKLGHFAYEGWDVIDGAGVHQVFRGAKVPVVEDEPIGAQEAPNPDLGRRDNRPDAFEDGGAGFGMGNAGATFHSDDLIQSIVPGPVQTTCAIAFFHGLTFFPADSATGRYSHDGFQDHPLDSTPFADEVADRVFGDHVNVVSADPTAQWRGVPRNGWRLAETLNARGNIFVVRR